jgi:hypothetical protein
MLMHYCLKPSVSCQTTRCTTNGKPRLLSAILSVDCTVYGTAQLDIDLSVKD